MPAMMRAAPSSRPFPAISEAARHSPAAVPAHTSTLRTDSFAHRCAGGLLAAVQVVASIQLIALAVPPPPALANTKNFTLEVREGEEEEYFQTAPASLSSTDDDMRPAQRLGSMLEGKRGKEVQQCAKKCVPTCIRGGQGAPGLGPMSVRRDEGGVLFKEGYRSRKYCLSECIQVCSLELTAKEGAAGNKK